MTDTVEGHAKHMSLKRDFWVSQNQHYITTYVIFI
jgi:hypothetical protein